MLDTHPYRVRMRTYQIEHGLAPERGFDVTRHGPLLGPGRRLLWRITGHMAASKRYPKVTKRTSLLTDAVRDALIPPLTFGQKVARTQLAEVGVHEIPWGSNRGARVEVYQHVTGTVGLAWCAAFRSWACRENGYRGKVSARAYDWLDIGTRIPTAQAAEGDAVIFKIGDGHIGTVLEVDHHAGTVKSVDGNTSDEVAVRVRPLAVVAGFTRQAA